MSVGHLSCQSRWTIEEAVIRYRSHARACELNADSSKDGLLNQVNRERAKRWHARADAEQAKLKAFDAERGQS